MTENLRHWEALGKTDPAHTKTFQRAGGPLLTDMQQRGHIFRARIAIERIDELYEQSPKMAAE